jgi:hypothetical protein
MTYPVYLGYSHWYEEKEKKGGKRKKEIGVVTRQQCYELFILGILTNMKKKGEEEKEREKKKKKRKGREALLSL